MVKIAEAERIRKNISFTVGHDIFTGTRGMIKDHIYPPNDNRIGDHSVRV